MHRLQAPRLLPMLTTHKDLLHRHYVLPKGALLTAVLVRPAGPMRESLCGSAALPALEAVRVLGAAPAPGLRARLEVLDARALRGAPAPDQALPALRRAALAPLQARPLPTKAAMILAGSICLPLAGAHVHSGQWPPCSDTAGTWHPHVGSRWARLAHPAPMCLHQSLALGHVAGVSHVWVPACA